MAAKFKYYFTITAGRTGTAWLADFLGHNLDTPAIHEPLEIDDFGVEMPNIKIMRSFNDRGNNAVVRKFWAEKLARIAKRPSYIETNHTLAKCGLVENLAGSPLADESALIVLRRDKVRQCVSYLVRGDFANVTLEWLWYLSPQYRNVIVAPGEFMKLGQLGVALWYCYEMEARQTYYLAQFAERMTFIEARLEEITKPAGARKLLEQIGINADPIMPPPVNTNRGRPDPDLTAKVSELVNRIRFDADALVTAYLESGRSLSQSRTPR
jgi:hypothetical protein